MALQNGFLVNLVQHNQVVGHCVCDLCRRLRLQKINDDALTRGQMYFRLINILLRRINEDLNKCFSDTLDVITCGKAHTKISV